MGRTYRHQKEEDHIVNFRSKRKGKQSRKDRKSKAALSNEVSPRSQRHISDAEAIKAMDEIKCVCGQPMKDCLGFDTMDEMLEELHEPDNEEKQR